jgi:hypothetical protein
MSPYPNAKSQELAALAKKIAEKAPSNVEGIILDGSVARGFADQFSDIELQFFLEDLPSTNEIIAWMKQANFEGELLIRLDDPDYKLLNQFYEGVRIELTWTSFAYEAAQLEDIMKRIGGASFINEAYKWPDAIPLKEHPQIAEWKALFHVYPDAVRERYIQACLQEWTEHLQDPIDSLGRWKDAYRGAWFYLLKTHWIDLLPTLRLVFAYNRVWEPVTKWWHIPAEKLQYKPENFVARVNNVLSNPNPVARVEELGRLQIECLILISNEYEVQDLIEKFRLVQEYGKKLK